MPAASLDLTLKTLSGAPIDDLVRVELLPVSSSGGGQIMRTPEFAMNGASTCRVNGLSCQGAGTAYTVRIETRRYQTAAFAKMIVPGAQKADPVALPVNPARVTGLDAPGFDGLEFHLQSVLKQSEIPEFVSNSGTFVQGEQLYGRLTDLRKACLLNIAAKANHPTAASIWPLVKSIVRIQQDRFFAIVKNSLQEIVGSSDQFVRVSNLLHEPMPGFEKDDSFKSKGQHATLQVTFMRKDDVLAADIDIDEDSGAEHAFEVIRKKFQGLTNPYQVHELMLGEGAVTPMYRLVY